MRFSYFFILIVFSFAIVVNAYGQNDSTRMVNNGKEISLDTLKPQKDSATVVLAKKDSVTEKKHDPRKATRRSAIIPGWGQAYNHQYWKLPLVYGALAVPASLFVYNNNWYQRTKEAYDILVNGGDTSKIYSDLKGVSAEDLQYYRNEFRKNRDYSALFFLLVWGLNVVDATVSAHLKDFNVSDDLSMRIRPDFNFSTKTPAISVALNFRSKQPKILPSSF
jgi:hypothetical protein